LSEGIRGLLATAFASVVMVADEGTLFSCVTSLRPDLVVLDLAIAPGGGCALLARLRARHPALRLIALSDSDEPVLRRAAAAAGAERYLLKRSLGTDLMPAVDELLNEPGQAQ
jgi:two-component system invasion response regulator UvrY